MWITNAGEPKCVDDSQTVDGSCDDRDYYVVCTGVKASARNAAAAALLTSDGCLSYNTIHCQPTRNTHFRTRNNFRYKAMREVPSFFVCSRCFGRTRRMHTKVWRWLGHRRMFVCRSSVRLNAQRKHVTVQISTLKVKDKQMLQHRQTAPRGSIRKTIVAALLPFPFVWLEDLYHYILWTETIF